MAQRSFSTITAMTIAVVILFLVGCRATAEPGAQAESTSPATAVTASPTMQVVESTIPVPPSPTTDATPEPVPQEEATTTPTSTATSSPTATASPAASATATATRAAPGVVVTSEPRVDVWTYGTGVVSAQIEGPLQTTIGFLNSLIVDGSGNSSLAYLDPALHAEALSNPNDGLVLGIDVSYTSFDVNWLGTSGTTSQVQGLLLYEGGGQATHQFDLRRSGDAWQISGVVAGP